MPLTKMRRPKHERQFIKQILFTTTLSCQRLLKIQNILNTKNLDAILIILGIDSRFDNGSQNVFNYLFFDVFTTRRDDVERSKMDDDVFDDVMISIKRNSIDVYCNGVNYWLLLPYMAHWPGVQIHYLLETDMDDPELIENFKMKTFIEITKGCDVIGVVTKTSKENAENTFDHMLIETWPIVQSFGHDDFGRENDAGKKRGFFTMVHKVVDVSGDVYDIINDIDPVTMENVYMKILPQLEGLYDNVFQLLDTWRSSTDFIVNEEVLEEPALTYHKHLQNQKVYENRFEFMPFTLSGHNTKEAIMKPFLMGNKLKESSVDSLSKREMTVTNPTHLLVQCVNFHFQIVIARTIILQNPGHSIEDSENVMEETNDIRILSEAYCAAVECVSNIIKSIKCETNKNLNSSKAEENLKEKLKNINYQNIHIKLMESDKKRKLKHGYLVFAQVVIFDIKGAAGNILGSVIYGDTFAVTELSLAEGNKYAILRLGKNIPICNVWNPLSLSKIQKAVRVSDGEGQKDENPLVIDTIEHIVPNTYFEETGVQEVNTLIFEDRFLLHGRKMGTCLLYPSSIDIYDEAFSDWTVMVLTVPESKLLKCMWINDAEKEDNLYKLYFAASNKSRLVKSLSSVLIPQWRKTISVELRNSEQDDKGLSKLSNQWMLIKHLLWQSKTTATTAVPPASASTSTTIHSHPISLSRGMGETNVENSVSDRKSELRTFCTLSQMGFSLKHSVGQSFTGNLQFCYQTLADLVKHQPGILSVPTNVIDQWSSNVAEEDSKSNTEDVILTIICGLPASGQLELVTKITSIIKENTNWFLLMCYQLEEVYPLLKETMEKVHDSKVPGTKQRIILIAPPFTMPGLILLTLKPLLDQRTATIGSICTTIDIRNAFSDNYNLLTPGLLDLCDEGFCQCILLLGNDKRVESLERILRIRNDMCSIHYVPMTPATAFSSNKVELSKQLDSVLSNNAFNQPRHQQARFYHSGCNAQILDEVKAVNNILCIVPNRLFEVRFLVKGKFCKEQILKTFSTSKFMIQEVEKAVHHIRFIDGQLQLEDDRPYAICWSFGTRVVQVSPIKRQIQRCNYSYVTFYVETPNIELTKRSSNRKEAQNKLRNKLVDLVKLLQRQKPLKKPYMKPVDVPKIDVDEIHKQRHLERLPEGWFYNGTTYVHMDGSRSEKHPSLDQFVEDFVAAENEKIKLYNAKVDDFKVPDIMIE